MAYNWDSVETGGGLFVSFKEPGDTVTGLITEIGERPDFNGDDVPALYLDVDGDEQIVTAGQILLKRALKEKKPQTGDTITITYTGLAGRAKQFTVTVDKGTGKPKTKPAAAMTAEELEAPF